MVMYAHTPLICCCMDVANLLRIHGIPSMDLMASPSLLQWNVNSHGVIFFPFLTQFILKQDISILSTSTQRHLKLMNIALVVSSESDACGVDMQTIFKGCI